MKRLDHVIIGTGAQAVDLVFPTVARRQDQDRIRMPVGAYLLDDIEAGDLGQSQVDDG